MLDQILRGLASQGGQLQRGQQGENSRRPAQGLRIPTGLSRSFAPTGMNPGGSGGPVPMWPGGPISPMPQAQDQQQAAFMQMLMSALGGGLRG